MLVDNAPDGMSGEWDFGLLTAEWGLPELEDLGFGVDELAAVFGSDEASDGNGDPDDVPDVDMEVEAVTQRGDLWLLGDHRLLCGDSTVSADVERVMMGEEADLIFTDPPYGINVVKNNYIGGDNISKANKYAPVHGDDKPFDPSFLLGLAENQMIFGGNYFSSKLPDSRGWLVWDKIDGMEGTTKNFSDFEMAWTNFDKPARLFRHRWQGLMTGKKAVLHNGDNQ